MSKIVTLTMNPALDIATDAETIAPGHKLRCSEPRYDPGGGGINVARALHRLGCDAVAVFPSGGLSGEMLCGLLAAEGVSTASVPIAGITRENFAVVERCSGRQYRFVLPGPQIGADDQARCLDRLASTAAGAAFVVASGSLPPGCPADFYRRVGELARHCGARFVLDTSGAALCEAGGGAFLIKTSLSELEQLSGAAIHSDADQESAVRAVLGRGCAETVVLSLGAEGALLGTADQMHRFSAIAVPAQSSIGAGDSMVAGILASLVRGWSLVDAVRFGVAAGAAALLTPGTELCRREDAERLYREAASAPSR